MIPNGSPSADYAIFAIASLVLDITYAKSQSSERQSTAIRI